MNRFSKIMLSDDELQLVNNTSWILTKRIIIDKVNDLLGELAADQKLVIEKEKHWLPAEVVQSEAKIAKGENYLQLPYVLLDYPRCFDTENIFAIRTMFWWGNFFSITLQLSGKYKERFRERILAKLGTARHDLFICIHENQWHHHFEQDNYIAVKEMRAAELKQIITEKQFIKLAVKFPLQSWDAIPALLTEAFNEMILLLKA